MAIINYSKNSILFKRDTSVENYEQLVLSTQPNTILYFGESSNLQEISGSSVEMTCSWATTCSISDNGNRTLAIFTPLMGNPYATSSYAGLKFNNVTGAPYLYYSPTIEEAYCWVSSWPLNVTNSVPVKIVVNGYIDTTDVVIGLRARIQKITTYTQLTSSNQASSFFSASLSPSDNYSFSIPNVDFSNLNAGDLYQLVLFRECTSSLDTANSHDFNVTSVFLNY